MKNQDEQSSNYQTSAIPYLQKEVPIIANKQSDPIIKQESDPIVDQELYEFNKKIFSEEELAGLKEALKYITAGQPIQKPIKLTNISEDMEPAPLSEEELKKNYCEVSEHLRLDDTIINPETVFEKYSSILLVPGGDPEEWNLRRNPKSFLVLSPKSDNLEENTRHLFTVTEHFEHDGCFDKYFGDCKESFKYQVLYKYKNQTFASLYEKSDCPCYDKYCKPCCCCMHFCDKHEDISSVRITKYPRFDYLPISKELGLTATPTSWFKKILDELDCCLSWMDEGIDYFNKKEKKYKYRLGQLGRFHIKCGCLSWECKGLSKCSNCVCDCSPIGLKSLNTSIIAYCCYICTSKDFCNWCWCCIPCTCKGDDRLIFIIDLEEKAIAGYVILKKGLVGKVPCCIKCELPECFYPQSHYEIFFPVGSSGLDKFMIFNLLIGYIYKHSNLQIGHTVFSFKGFEELRNFDQPTDEEMKLFVK